MIKLWLGSVGGCFIGSIAAMGFYLAGLPSSVQGEIDQDKMYWIAGQNGLIAGVVSAAVLSALGFGKPNRKELQVTGDPRSAIAQRMSDPALTAAEFTQLSAHLVRLEELALDRQASAAPSVLASQPNP